MKIGALIRITDQPVCSVWIDGERYESTLEKLPAYKGALVVLVPTTQVLLTTAKVPARQRQRVLQALPYALEDRLAEDVEDLHFALGECNAQGQQQVAVIAHTYMEQLQERLQTAGVQAQWIIPDVLAVPYPEKGWGLLYLGNVALLRTGAHSGFALETHTLKQVLPMLLDTESSPRPSLIHTYKSGSLKEAEALSTLDTLGVALEDTALEQGDIQLFAHHLQHVSKAQAPINLRQGVYLRSAQWREGWKPWRLSAALLGLLLVVYTTLQIQQVLHLRTQREALKHNIHTLYKTTFPTARKIVNPRLQMEQKLSALRAEHGSSASEEGVLPLLQRISPILRKTANIVLQRLDYRQQYLDLSLQLSSLQNLENIKQDWLKQKLQVDVRSASSRNNKVEAQVRIRFE